MHYLSLNAVTLCVPSLFMNTFNYLALEVVNHNHEVHILKHYCTTLYASIELIHICEHWLLIGCLRAVEFI